MGEFASAIQDALSQSSNEAVVDSVKTMVINEIQAVDPSLEIRKTDYFNHSFVPDIVLTWQDEGTTRHRNYFLRFDVAQPELAEDIERLDGEDPAFFGLLTDSVDSPLTPATMGELAEHPRVLVTHGAAVEALHVPGSSPSLGDLVPPAVVRGGRGWLDTSAATALVEAAYDGFRGVTVLDYDVTSKAIGSVRRFLRDEYAQEVERSLGLLWIGAGGEPDAFPSDIDISKTLSPGRLKSILSYLFAAGVIEDDFFWERVSEWVTEGDLFAFGVLEPNPNLQRLIRAKLRDLRFVGVAADYDDAGRALSLGEPEWFVAPGDHLGLRTSHVVLDFVRDGRKHNTRPLDHPAVPLSVLSARAGKLTIESVGVESEVAVVTFDAKGRASVMTDPWFASVGGTTGSGPAVNAVVVRLPESGGRLRCDLERQVATVENSAQKPLSELGRIGAQMMLSLRPEDQEELELALRPSTPTGQLF